MEALNATQESILGYIKLHLRRGYPPSMQDIAGNLGIRLSSVQYNLDQLERKGRIVREPGRARTLRLTDELTIEQRADQFLEAIAGQVTLTREAVIAAFKKMDEVAA